MGFAQQFHHRIERPRRIAGEDFDRFDLILAMDHSNLADLQRRCPPQYQHKLKLLLSYGDSGVAEVPDPYYGGPQGFERVLDLVEDACAGLLAALRAGQP